MSKRKSPPKPPKGTDPDYAVGYKRPPLHSRFKPGESGNREGPRKSLKRRNIARDIQDVFTRKILVQVGGRKRWVPSIVALIQRALVDAMKGDKRATQFSYRIAETFGVFKLKDDVRFDFSKLSEEERAICTKGAEILNRAGLLMRYEDRN
jgi:hypothetical protein